MKSRDEFLQSVYTKEKAVKAQRKICKRRMITSLTAAAACLVLVVGIGRISGAGLMGGGMDGVDSAVPEDAVSYYAGSESDSDSAPSDDESSITSSENESDSAGSGAEKRKENVASGNAVPGNTAPEKIAPDDAAPGDGAPGDTLVESAQPGILNVSGYYCMPVAVVVENADGNGIRYEEFSEMDQAIKWVRELAGDGKAFRNEELPAEKKQSYVYKVTLVYSSEDDPDSSDSDQIYYILEEVEYFE